MGALKNVLAGASSGSSGGILGSAIGAGAGLIGSLLGVSSQKETNRNNLKMMREQNEFNAKQAEIQRSWQQQMVNQYGTAQAQAAQYRAAGLNPQLANVSPQSVGTGATAQASETIPQQSLNYSGIGSAVQSGLQFYQQQQSIDNQKVVQDSVAALNETQGALNKALALQSDTRVSQMKQEIENLKIAYDFSAKTLASRVRQQYLNETVLSWQSQDIEYSSLLKSYELFNIAPQQVQQLQSQTIYNYASAFRAVADGKLTLKELEYLPKKYAIMQTSALGSLYSGEAALTSAAAVKELNHSLSQESAERKRGLTYENNGKAAYWDWLSSSDDKNLQFIKSNSRANQLYNLTLKTNQATLNKLLEEPELVRSMSRYYDAGAFNHVVSPLENIVNDVQQFNMINSSEETNGYQEETIRYDKHGNETGRTVKNKDGGRSRSSRRRTRFGRR